MPGTVITPFFLPLFSEASKRQHQGTGAAFSTMIDRLAFDWEHRARSLSGSHRTTRMLNEERGRPSKLRFFIVLSFVGAGDRDRTRNFQLGE